MTNQESNSAQCACCAASYRSVILPFSNSFYKTEIDMKNRLTKKLRCLRRAGSALPKHCEAGAPKGHSCQVERAFGASSSNPKSQFPQCNAWSSSETNTP